MNEYEKVMDAVIDLVLATNPKLKKEWEENPVLAMDNVYDEVCERFPDVIRELAKEGDTKK